MKYLFGVLFMAFCLVPVASAQPPAHAQGKAKGRTVDVGQAASDAVKRTAVEAVDAVVDEIAGDDGAQGASGMPPGLAKKGKMPPGLEKQGKVPPGWSKGNKVGWTGGSVQPKKESLVRRMIRGIFRGKKAGSSESE